MKLRSVLLLAVLAPLLLVTGCVTGRRTVDLHVPAAAESATPRGTVRITSIEDGRTFERRPRDPSIPSVSGNLEKMSAEQRAAMIGRQRNTYGMAMGDIALPAPKRVTTVAGDLLAQALRRRGYEVTEDAPATARATIDEFWGWFTPGFWSVAFEARVCCTLVVDRGSGESVVVIRGEGLNRGQVARDANWQLAFERAFEDFLEKAGPALADAGW